MGDAVEAADFYDEHGRHWTGWRSDAGKVDLSGAAEMVTLNPEQLAAYERAAELVRRWETRIVPQEQCHRPDDPAAWGDFSD